MGHRPRCVDVLDLERDRVGLEDTDPNGQDPLVLLVTKITIGMLVTGSTVSPLIVISMSMVVAGGQAAPRH